MGNFLYPTKNPKLRPEVSCWYSLSFVVRSTIQEKYNPNPPLLCRLGATSNQLIKSRLHTYLVTEERPSSRYSNAAKAQSIIGASSIIASTPIHFFSQLFTTHEADLQQPTSDLVASFRSTRPSLPRNPTTKTQTRLAPPKPNRESNFEASNWKQACEHTHGAIHPNHHAHKPSNRNQPTTCPSSQSTPVPSSKISSTALWRSAWSGERRSMLVVLLYVSNIT